MNSNTLLVQEYLASLKEDKELDRIFPLLLSSMDYRIVQTAKEAKGQSQYGKDIIAIGEDKTGQRYRWYFELKGYADRDITDRNYSKTDGIRESIIEAKDTAFKDSSIPEFNSLPIKIVLVHNGIIKPNIRPTFDGFIEKNFAEGEFERWDIHHLTGLFSKYLFNEYLLSDEESNRLFKRTLVFLDSPGYDYRDFKDLVDRQFVDLKSPIQTRNISKLFGTLNLLKIIIQHFSQANNNLTPAKECSKYITLKTWHWILQNKLENESLIIREFRKLLIHHYEIFNAYFKKTFPVTRIENGLYGEEKGGFFEFIGYPLRCFDYLEDILHYCRLRLQLPSFDKCNKHSNAIRSKQKDLLIKLIDNNSGFYRPVLDHHSIVIIQLFIFFVDEADRREKDIEFITHFVFKTIHNIIIEKLKHDRLPELYNRLEALIESFAKGTKTDDYQDSSSILVAVLMELTTILDNEGVYNDIITHIQGVSFQIPNAKFEEGLEELLFERNLYDEYFVEDIGTKPRKFKDFKKRFFEYRLTEVKFRTDHAGFKYLRYLAHSYFKNELPPDEWRKFREV